VAERAQIIDAEPAMAAQMFGRLALHRDARRRAWPIPAPRRRP
jgi:hypothetical protein